MRIAQFVHTLRVGGAETVAVDLALRLQQRGHQLAVVCLHESGELAERLEAAGIEVVALEKHVGFDVKPLIGLRNFLRERGFDVVHSHNTHLHHHAAVAARAAGVAVLVNTVHGLVNIPATRRARMLYVTSAFTTDRITAVCEPVAKALSRELVLPKAMIDTIPNGIDPTPFADAPQPRASGEELVFGTVGRFVEVKNQLALIEAFAEVNAEHPGTRLRLMGYGALEQPLREAILSRGLGDVAELVDGRGDIAEFLGSLDVFALSSKSEGLPMSLLEAMAAGRPAIAPRVGGIPEVVEGGRCGWLVDAGTPEQLAAAMRLAIESPEREALGTRARQHLLARYTLDAMANRYERLFERLLSQPRPLEATA